MKYAIILASLLFSCLSASAASTVWTDVVDANSVDATGSTFVSKSAVYSSSASFRCSFSDEQEAKRLAEDSATFKCLEKEFESCVVKQSVIIQTGYLGYQEDFEKNLGYGCIARALVRGK